MKLFTQNFFTGIVIILLVFSMICQVIIGVLYQNMIHETDNMTSTDNKLLKSCKLKFTNCYHLNLGVANIPIFVDKFINRLRIGYLSFYSISHLGGQAMLLSVLVSGIGICRGIIEGKTLGNILPYYIISFLGLYLYFSVSAFMDISGKKKVLKTNLVDYLENHMVNRLQVSMNDEFEASPILSRRDNTEIRKGRNERNYSKKELFTGAEERELEELLKEFLT
ncbi:MAG TPA: hypothetical protein VJZ04_07805 [Lachnospiraceae bacterium]|nr:hypothetical protein [Lachnospiraceae bacterium]